MSRGRKILYGVVGFVVRALGLTAPGLIAAHSQKKAAEAAIDDYSRALVAHDYQRAFAFGDEGFQEALSFQEFAQQQRELESEFGALRQMSRRDIYLHGRGSPMRWISIIKVTAKYERSDLEFAYELHFENGQWKLFGFKQL